MPAGGDELDGGAPDTSFDSCVRRPECAVSPCAWRVCEPCSVAIAPAEAVDEIEHDAAKERPARVGYRLGWSRRSLRQAAAGEVRRSRSPDHASRSGAVVPAATPIAPRTSTRPVATAISSTSAPTNSNSARQLCTRLTSPIACATKRHDRDAWRHVGTLRIRSAAEHAPPADPVLGGGIRHRGTQTGMLGRTATRVGSAAADAVHSGRDVRDRLPAWSGIGRRVDGRGRHPRSRGSSARRSHRPLGDGRCRSSRPPLIPSDPRAATCRRGETATPRGRGPSHRACD